MDDIFTIRFREAIKTSGMTQVELANRVKISKQCISDFKSGNPFRAFKHYVFYVNI